MTRKQIRLLRALNFSWMDFLDKGIKSSSEWWNIKRAKQAGVKDLANIYEKNKNASDAFYEGQKYINHWWSEKGSPNSYNPQAVKYLDAVNLAMKKSKANNKF